MSTWLDRLRALDSTRDACADSANSANSPPNGTNGTNGTGIEAQKEASEPPAEPIAWVDRPDVVTAVEDLADEGWRPRRISRHLGLTVGEVIVILRRTGR